MPVLPSYTKPVNLIYTFYSLITLTLVTLGYILLLKKNTFAYLNIELPFCCSYLRNELIGLSPDKTFQQTNSCSKSRSSNVFCFLFSILQMMMQHKNTNIRHIFLRQNNSKKLTFSGKIKNSNY